MSAPNLKPSDIDLEASSTKTMLRKLSTKCALYASAANLNYKIEGKRLCSCCLKKRKEDSPHE